ncbi:5-formyltetrahydrofolate cyclo-ligase [bacterium]|nr:5-formyltetrahydrofolate cyclo-ligase [bacterium]
MVKNTDKPSLRTYFRRLRAAEPKRAEKAEQLKATFFEADLLKGVHSIALFDAMKDEIDVRPLAVALRREGFQVVYPYTQEEGLLGFRLVRAETQELVPHESYPLHEPKTGLPEVEPDLILVPLVAFDSAGRRLGMGGGYYDRTIAFLRAKGRMVPCIGLAFDVQRSETALPHDAHDMMLDGVVTETRFHDFRK